jgi:DNA-binding NarL/FixJ family response regulator
VAFEHVMLAEARLAAGDHDGCLALLDAGERDGSWVDPWSRVGRYELMTRAALRAHRYDEADQWAGRAEAVATELATPARTALAALARAQVLAVGEPLAAASVALPAAAALGAAGLVLDAARARAVAGCALATAGHLTQALDELAVAQAEFAGCGARRPEREVAAQRQRLDGRLARPKRSRSGVDALTARERQVAALVGQGMTNRQIAARLVVTEKTVEMHLSRAFTKLGVSNRTGLVRQMLLAQ